MKKIKGRTVGEIVRGRPVYVVQENNSVLEAARYMTEYQIGAVPVLAEGQLTGIISERDVMAYVVAQELDPVSTKVNQVMTREVIAVSEDSACRQYRKSHPVDVDASESHSSRSRSN